MDLRTTRESVDRAEIVAVAGEVDLYTAPALEAALEAAMDGAGALVVDFSQCTFVDSTALGVLLRVHRRLEDTGRQLEVVASTPQVLRVFEVTGLERALHVAPTREDALARIGATPPGGGR